MHRCTCGYANDITITRHSDISIQTQPIILTVLRIMTKNRNTLYTTAGRDPGTNPHCIYHTGRILFPCDENQAPQV